MGSFWVSDTSFYYSLWLGTDEKVQVQGPPWPGSASNTHPSGFKGVTTTLRGFPRHSGATILISRQEKVLNTIEDTVPGPKRSQSHLNVAEGP